jgi:endoribonuclease Dicer
MEALIGAVYVSSSFTTAEPFFNSILQPFYDRYVTPPGKRIVIPDLAQHPTKTLFELIQSYGCSNFAILREITDDGPECTSKLYHNYNPRVIGWS